MNRWGLLAIALTIIAAASAVMLVLIPAPKSPLEVAATASSTPTPGPATSTPAGIADLITVDSPLPYDKISSPLSISGKARGNWFFEAQAPIKLYDQGGNLLAQGIAHANGDWMTMNYVPFTAELTFTPPSKGGTDGGPLAYGSLVLNNDNPSDNPDTYKTLIIPIIFQ